MTGFDSLALPRRVAGGAAPLGEFRGAFCNRRAGKLFCVLALANAGQTRFPSWVGMEICWRG
jgi:hypothetical protein